MSDLRQEAEQLEIWLGSDDIRGPNCRTVERMNAIRDLLIKICDRLDRLSRGRFVE